MILKYRRHVFFCQHSVYCAVGYSEIFSNQVKMTVNRSLLIKSKYKGSKKWKRAYVILHRIQKVSFFNFQCLISFRKEKKGVCELCSNNLMVRALVMQINLSHRFDAKLKHIFSFFCLFIEVNGRKSTYRIQNYIYSFPSCRRAFAIFIILLVS